MNHVDIFLLDCSSICVDDSSWQQFISPLRQKKLDCVTHPNAKKLSLGAELALAAALSYRNLPHTPPEYFYDNTGKPRFFYSNLHFSLSHSENFAVCAISDAEIGVDIECPRRISSNISRFTLSPSETDCPPEEILKKWVIKESFLKLTGNGIKPNSMQQVTAKHNLILNNEYEILAHYSLYDNVFGGRCIIGCCSYSEFTADITELSVDEIKK